MSGQNCVQHRGLERLDQMIVEAGLAGSATVGRDLVGTPSTLLTFHSAAVPPSRLF